ncbi:MAG: threonine synthase [FCB group bacterium]|nr:threonine synthase [FCB group bacterium]
MPENLQFVLGYKCVCCGKEFAPEPFRYRCECGNNLDVVYHYDRLKKVWSKDLLKANPEPSIWRYGPLLPLKRTPLTSGLHVGGTPLLKVPRGSSDEEQQLYLKDDTRNPSGSLKDRATAVGVQHAMELQKKTLIAASTGNAAASLAALAAYYGLRAVILAPATAPAAKLTQILQYGATLIPVGGTYDEAFDLSMQVAEQFGWYSRSTGINPMLSEGKKTVALEIAEQLNWQMPDWVFIPTGDGCIAGGVYKGFYDLQQLGWIETIPGLIAVQAENSAAIVKALESGADLAPVDAHTVADSICVDFPRDGLKALNAVKSSGGFGITVTDDEILKGQKDLATRTGIFAEPAAASAYAGYQKAVHENLVTGMQSAVLLITGSGLKDIESAKRKIMIPSPVEPVFPAVREFLRQADLC